MSDLTVLVPTRSRPHAVIEMATAFAETCTAQTSLVFCVDGCPREADYVNAARLAQGIYPLVRTCLGSRRRLVGSLNFWAKSQTLAPYAIGYLGDDHRPRTPGWDAAYLAALRKLGTGIVYGNDLIQGPNLPTAVAMTTDIITTLGHMAPPCLTHMYCDNYWIDLGLGASCITYLPEITVEHCHPSAGRTAWDASYTESNSADSYEHDRLAYQHYRLHSLPGDIAKVRALRDPDPASG